jgi:hypothetical protein
MPGPQKIAFGEMADSGAWRAEFFETTASSK